jgi:Mg2+ and Co2+ transporter CorA
VTIKALLSRGDGSDEEVAIDGTRLRIADDELVWVDLIGASDTELAALDASLALAEPAAASLRDDVPAPGATVTDGAISVSVLSLETADTRPVPMQILVGTGWIITRHAEPMALLDDRRERITDQREVGLLSSAAFLASVLDWHVDSFFAAAEELETAVDRLDEAALRTEGDLLPRLVEMRRKVARVRRVAARHRELFAELARPDFLLNLERDDAEALARVTTRLERAAESISHAREMLIGTFDVYMTRTAQRTNDIVRVLTWASVILLPAGVIAGIMGMNFKVPIFEEPAYFFAVIAFMVTLAAVTLLVARRRGWL